MQRPNAAPECSARMQRRGPECSPECRPAASFSILDSRWWMVWWWWMEIEHRELSIESGCG